MLPTPSHATGFCFHSLKYEGWQLLACTFYFVRKQQHLFACSIVDIRQKHLAAVPWQHQLLCSMGQFYFWGSQEGESHVVTLSKE